MCFLGKVSCFFFCLVVSEWRVDPSIRETKLGFESLYCLRLASVAVILIYKNNELAHLQFSNDFCIDENQKSLSWVIHQSPLLQVYQTLAVIANIW